MSEPKFEKGDWVRCTRCGYEFQIALAQNLNNKYFYFSENENGCKHDPIWHGVPEHLLEPVTDFKKGDIVECLEDLIGVYAPHKFDKLTVSNNSPSYDPTCLMYFKEIAGGWLNKRFKLIKRGGGMSKYEDLKRRIGKVEGWTKDTDNLIKEIVTDIDGLKYISIPCGLNDRIDITDNGLNIKVSFNFTSQCTKNEAFKKALLWLLDNSKHKDDKQDEINAIQKQIDELQVRVKGLKND